MLRNIDNFIETCHKKIETRFNNVGLFIKPYFDAADDFEYIGPIMVLAPIFLPGFICMTLLSVADGYSLLVSIVFSLVLSAVVMGAYLMMVANK